MRIHAYAAYVSEKYDLTHHNMPRLALTLLVSTLSASAFAPSGQAAKPRTAVASTTFADSLSSPPGVRQRGRLGDHTQTARH